MFFCWYYFFCILDIVLVDAVAVVIWCSCFCCCCDVVDVVIVVLLLILLLLLLFLLLLLLLLFLFDVVDVVILAVNLKTLMNLSSGVIPRYEFNFKNIGIYFFSSNASHPPPLFASRLNINDNACLLTILHCFWQHKNLDLNLPNFLIFCFTLILKFCFLIMT